MRNIDVQSKIMKLRQAISLEESDLNKATRKKRLLERQLSDMRRQRTSKILRNRVNPMEGLRKQRKLNATAHKLSDLKQRIKSLGITVDHDKRELSTLYTLQRKIKGGDTHALYQLQHMLWRT